MCPGFEIAITVKSPELEAAPKSKFETQVV
jgi:hypothetical protein